MMDSECRDAIRAGHAVASRLKADGFGILALGEIGIGNTSAASLVAHCVTGLPLERLVGPGAGAPPGGLSHKREVLAELMPALPFAAAWKPCESLAASKWR